MNKLETHMWLGMPMSNRWLWCDRRSFFDEWTIFNGNISNMFGYDFARFLRKMNYEFDSLIMNFDLSISFVVFFNFTWARVIVDRIILSNGICRIFKRSPVNAACLRPISVNKRSASVIPSRLYWPCRMRIKCRTAFGLTASNRSLCLFSSSGVAFDFIGFTKLAGSRL